MRRQTSYRFSLVSFFNRLKWTIKLAKPSKTGHSLNKLIITFIIHIRMFTCLLPNKNMHVNGIYSLQFNWPKLPQERRAVLNFPFDKFYSMLFFFYFNWIIFFDRLLHLNQKQKQNKKKELICDMVISRHVHRFSSKDSIK